MKKSKKILSLIGLSTITAFAIPVIVTLSSCSSENGNNVVTILNVDQNTLLNFLNTNINKSTFLKNDILNILNNNKDLLVKSINANLTTNEIESITINDQNEIVINFANNVEFNPMNNQLENLEIIKTNKNKIIISNLGIIDQPILDTSNSVVPEEFYNNSLRPIWNPNQGGLDSEDYSFNYKNNPNYNGDRRTKYANLQEYDTAISHEVGFPGFPSFENNWKNVSSSAYQIMLSQATELKTINEVIDEWENKLKNDNYIYLDSNFIKNEIINNRLKKYPGIDNMFGNFSVTLNQPAVSRTFSISSMYSNTILLGLYAPAGEVITLKIPVNEIPAIKKMNLQINIGNEWQEYANIKNFNISFRLPRMNAVISLNDLINYYQNTNNIINNELIVKFGSPMGGAIYLRNKTGFSQETVNYGNIEFTVDGAIEYANYIHGYTTEQEWFRLVNETHVPIFSIFSPSFNMFKPWFVNSNDPRNDDLTLLNKAKQNTPKYRTDFFNNIFRLSQYMTSNDIGYNNDTLLKNQLFFSQDYIAAGSALNCWGEFIQIPMYEANNIFEPSTYNNTGAVNDWCLEHEGNHSYESKYSPFNKFYDETFNNVLNIIENACLADETLKRNELNFVNSGWGRTNSAFNSFNPHKNNLNQWTLTDDYWTNYAAYIHSVGTKYSTKWARSLSMLRKILNGNYVKINGKNWNYSAISYAMFSLIANVNMWDFIQNSLLMTIPEGDNWFNNPENEVGEQYQLIYNKYIKNLPVYHPIGCLYASGNYLPKDQNHNTWEYSGDSVRPFMVYKNVNYHFNIKNYIKFTNIQNNELATLKTVSVINNPKYGTITMDDDQKGFRYLPNKDANINDMDEIIVEVVDSFNEKNRFLIRPLISLSSTYEDKIITFNPEFVLENQKIKDFISSNKNNKIKLFKKLPTLINNNNFNVSSTSEMLAKDISSSQIFNNKCINQNQIRWSSFAWTAPETGWYRINLNVVHDNWKNFDFGTVSPYENNSLNSQISNEQVLIENERWLKNANYERYGKLFEPETKPVKLNKDTVYVFNFFSIISDQNCLSSNTFEKVSINFLGANDQDKNKTNIDLKHQPFANHIETKIFDQYSTTIQLLQQNINFNLKNYLWYVENSDFFKNQYFIDGVNNFNDCIRNKQIGSLTDINNVSLSKNTTSVDSNEVVISRFLGKSSGSVHITSKIDNATAGGFDINLLQPINTKKIQILFRRDQYGMNSAQKTKITNLENNEVIFNDFITNWWDGQNAYIELKNNVFLKHFRIEFIRCIDDRVFIPQEYRDSSKKNIGGWIILDGNSLKFSSFADNKYNTYKYMKYGYSIFNENIEILGPWNITSNNALFINKQLISRYNKSRIIINIPKNISEVAILGDQFNSSAEFKIYLDNELYGTYNNHSNTPLPASILAELKINDTTKIHKIIIETINANNDNPFSFQGILLK